MNFRPNYEHEHRAEDTAISRTNLIPHEEKTSGVKIIPLFLRAEKRVREPRGESFVAVRELGGEKVVCTCVCVCVCLIGGDKLFVSKLVVEMFEQGVCTD